MLKELRKKLPGGGNNNGFTLVEMLIVVAIIAILIAISIPLVNNALEKARHATDAANERAAKAVMLVEVLDGGTTKNAIYDAKDGSLKTTSLTSITVYGKHKGHELLQVSYGSDGNVYMKWVKTTAVGSGVPAALTTDGTAAAEGLCGATAVGDTH